MAVKKNAFKYRHGITVEQYNARLASQSGVCALCKSPPKKKRLSVDHDHRCCPGSTSCGDCIRWLLCTGCNFLFGYAKDDMHKLLKAADMLYEYENRKWGRTPKEFIP